MSDFTNQLMLTCLGNKRKLVRHIRQVVDEIRSCLGKDKLNIFDGFSGSSVVSRELSHVADKIYSNDLELYSYLMSYCYLMRPSEIQIQQIESHINEMNRIARNGPYKAGIITKLYAPMDTNDVKIDERCFYTHENALIIDTLRTYIEDHVEKDIQVYCLVPLLNKASIHTNTSGVFKGFYKDNNNKGCFGGQAKNALSRIMKPIELEIPIWNLSSNYTAFCFNKDINDLVKELPDDIDIIYLDPPYNQHPYGSNYFMLNIISRNIEPEELSKVSGIPKKWNKSKYNSKSTAFDAMRDLITESLKKATYILVSYNNEGIIKNEDWIKLLADYEVKKYEIDYDTFRGSRNLKKRSNKVVEIMYLIKYKL